MGWSIRKIGKKGRLRGLVGLERQQIRSREAAITFKIWTMARPAG